MGEEEAPAREGARASSIVDDVLIPVPRLGRAPEVHPSATVARGAVLGEGVRIGPGAVVGPNVRLGARVQLGAHAVLEGDLEVGEDTRIWPGAVVGAEPQDLGYRGEPTGVTVGARCAIREHVTVNRATGEGSRTIVESDVLLMSGSHVAHNCRVRAEAILAGGSLLAGHVELGPQAFVSGNVVVHQYVRIGRLAMISGGSRVGRDVPPFALLVGDSLVRGLNGVGIRRRRIPRESQEELRLLYRLLYARGTSPAEGVAAVASRARTPEGLELLAFLRADSRRGLSAGVRPARVP